jgi:RNA polymerase sigma-70 factor (sigma-E family)
MVSRLISGTMGCNQITFIKRLNQSLAIEYSYDTYRSATLPVPCPATNGWARTSRAAQLAAPEAGAGRYEGPGNLRRGSRARRCDTASRWRVRIGDGSRPDMEIMVTDGIGDFVEFAAARSDALFRTALLLCGDWHLAEDLVQIALGKVYRSWSRVDRTSNPAAYARTVLVRSYLSHRRRPSSREQPLSVLPDTPAEEPDVTLRVVLFAALADLRPRDRAVVILRFLEDLTVDEVAAELGLSPGAVRNRSMRALARLRDLLGEELTSQPFDTTVPLRTTRSGT